MGTISVTGDAVIDKALELSRRNRKPFNKTERWRLAIGMNQKLSGPMLNGRGNMASSVDEKRHATMEPVLKYGGRRKPRKKG